MALKRNDNDYGLGGQSLTLTAVADLDALRPSERAVVSAFHEAVFRGFPASVDALANTASAPFAAWLRSLRGCVLEVHLPAHSVKPESMVRFDNGQAFFGEPAAVSGPAALAQVWALIGGINLAYANSGTLPPPPAPTGRQLMAMGLYQPTRAIDDCVSMWEADGDHLLVAPDGNTFWIGDEHAVGAVERSVDDALIDIFDALRAGRDYPQ